MSAGKCFKRFEHLKVIKAPVLKLSQAMIAILAQFKDPQGSILVMKPPDAKQNFEMEVVYRLETLLKSNGKVYLLST